MSYSARVTTAERIAELESDLVIVRQTRRTILTGGQAYSAEGRAMTRADLAELSETEKLMADELRLLKRGSGPRVFGVIHQ